MTSWPSNIERWRQFANWESKDIPTDLVLSIINNESGGQAGIKSTVNTKAADLPTDSGGSITVNNAMGLMQVIPPNVAAWNQNKTPTVTYEDMTGHDERAVRLQIKLGSSIFASSVYQLHKFDPVEFPGSSPGGATPEQLKLALVAYAIGAGKKGGDRGLIPKLERLREMKRPLTLEALKVNFPKWGYSESKQKWINRPTHAATKVWTNYKRYGVGAPTPGPPAPGLPGKKPFMDGWGIGLLFFGGAIALYVLRKDIEKLFKPS